MTKLRRAVSLVLAAAVAVPAPALAQHRAAPIRAVPVAGALGAVSAAPSASLAPSLGAPAHTAPSLAVLAPAGAAPSAALAAPALAPAAVPAAARPSGAASPAVAAALAAAVSMPAPARARAEELIAAFDLKSAPAAAASEGEAPKALEAAKAPAAPAPAAAPSPASKRSTQGPLFVTDKKGVVHPLGYNPALPYKSLWREGWEWIIHFPSKVAGVFRYMRRARELVNAISDEDLAWSLNRFDIFENQEGILRQGNRELVNDWKKWSGTNLTKVTPDDFNASSVSRISIRKIFKQAMDREEPTRAYQWTSAMNLHNYLPRVAHFMGVTFQERVIAVALRGEAPVRSVWAAEEERHGNIMERVYNFSREKGQPELKEQGIAPTSPKPGAYSSSSMMANRSLAEIGAGTGYLFLKANAVPGSPADLALEGIFRDEVYHYVLMNAARLWGMGIKGGRLGLLWHIIKHQFDNPLPPAVDAVVDERKGISPLTVFEIGYAFWQIDKRVWRYLKTVDPALGKKLVGKAYRSEKEVRQAVAEGRHTWTDPFAMELNPEMSAEDVKELERRFPGRFDASRRVLKASQVREVLARYRESLAVPSYWLRKKGFKAAAQGVDGAVHLRRETGAGAKRALFELTFPRSGEPVLRVSVGEEGRVVLDAPLSKVTMRQFGAVFGAEDSTPVENLAALAEDYSPAEISKRLLKSPAYQASPIPVLED